jgi:hypothetical protein
LVTHKCPRCGSEEIRTLSSIHDTGLPATSTARKPAHEMALSRQAAPPTKKPALMWVAVAAVFAVVALTTLSRSAVMTAVAFSSAAVAIGFAARAMTYNSMVFPRLHEQWEHSCMCNRCGTVFVE